MKYQVRIVYETPGRPVRLGKWYPTTGIPSDVLVAFMDGFLTPDDEQERESVQIRIMPEHADK